MFTKKRPQKKLIIFSLLLLVVVAVVFFGFNRSGNNITVVQADLAYINDISEIVTASGRIEPKTKVDIVSEVSAQIRELFVKEGDLVEKGTCLLLLDTVQLKADYAQARFSLDELTARADAAKTELEKNKLEFNRQASLYEKQLTSETAFSNARFACDNSQANYDAVLAQVKTGQARLEKMEDNLAKTKITAPMKGVITFLNTEAGEIAQAQTAYTQGKTLMTISDLSVFEVEVDVDETEIAKIKLGQSAGIRVDAFMDTTFEGTVVEIGNSALIKGQGTENYTTSFRVKIRFAETNPGIRPGMSASVDITTAHSPEALLIPYAAIVTREFNPDSLKNMEALSGAGKGLVEAVQASELNDSTGTAASGDSSNQGDLKDKFRKKADKIKKTGVFCVLNGKVHFKEVTTGIADEQNIVALCGVTPGDTIVSGSFQTLRKLKDGENVRIDDNSLTKFKENEH
ncbi:MAG: efflux RND transporter periplasmic adaptor subunit [candidate division Zixibacteria bacterium]|nr:efflux RND transporter periplasmic adaptor subunit [candidate division Zixibacteria bacterium]MDD5426102.1 efflux RND transporter periplasmic adaptor subunit [candidate division Zixibacteria bacterium]